MESLKFETWKFETRDIEIAQTKLTNEIRKHTNQQIKNSEFLNSGKSQNLHMKEPRETWKSGGTEGRYLGKPVEAALRQPMGPGL